MGGGVYIYAYQDADMLCIYACN